MPNAVLYHVTPLRNLESILENGIDPSYSTGKMRASWFLTHSKVEWGILHVMSRHKVPLNQVVVIAARMPVERVRKFQRGKWYSFQLTEPARLFHWEAAAVYAESGVCK